MLKKGEKKEALSRRNFLGGSVAATVASIILPGKGLAGQKTDKEQVYASEEFGIAFQSARPIWPRGCEKEMNLFVGFRAAFEPPPGKHVYLRMAGCTFYRVYLNGKFHAWGPARGPQNHFRVDLWDITPLLEKGRNYVAVEVAGYNVNSYYVLESAIFSPGGSGDGFRGAGFNRRSRAAL